MRDIQVAPISTLAASMAGMFTTILFFFCCFFVLFFVLFINFDILGEYLPPQLIYKGVMDRCHPQLLIFLMVGTCGILIVTGPM